MGEGVFATIASMIGVRISQVHTAIGDFARLKDLEES